MGKFNELNVWKLAHNLTLAIYKMTAGFPESEKFGLTSQLRRATASICANIAEGTARHTTKEFLQFLYNSRGSLSETEYHLLLAKDLGFISSKTYEKLLSDCELVWKMLNGLINSQKNKKDSMLVN